MRASRPLTGEVYVPGDKSISHRAVILGSLAEGTTEITNFLHGEDCLRTITAFQAMGVTIHNRNDKVIIEGRGKDSLCEPVVPLYFGNSGTTARLMLGLLAGMSFFTVAFGDESLTKRPMDRVVEPLRKMGAAISGRNNGRLLPLSINGKQLKGIEYTMPVQSAQVKSALLLAGLFAEGKTTITEDVSTRNHTENMLQAFGATISVEEKTITLIPNRKLKATNVFVPGDISSAAFFMAAAIIVPESNVTLKNVGINPTRAGILDVLDKMGAAYSIQNKQEVAGEALGDISIAYSKLKGTTVEGPLIPRLIDEIPVIALIATQAEGTTIIKDASELRVKETDRIQAVVDVLSKLGADITATEDGMIIHGKTVLSGAPVSSYYDHRIAMMAAIASLIAQGKVEIDDVSPIAISYPTFFEELNRI
ncbi:MULTISPECIES: 3-phosphoshikimate 1-carboxyvinyltransferase [unclassified Virgibacillus]|uniref:3-phosphoshikimate 1-carboxyvinyltransferase n=1 Tax=Virgibacillus sp. LDC-1 TaxID=3039856 RepID=UPI0024DECE2A|nr:3-phosphoshikimate 1-carboxyvinyltransferase [Virgibacillus sp. LDC-1]